MFESIEAKVVAKFEIIVVGIFADKFFKYK